MMNGKTTIYCVENWGANHGKVRYVKSSNQVVVVVANDLNEFMPSNGTLVSGARFIISDFRLYD